MKKNILFVFVLFSLLSTAENEVRKSITPGQIWKDDRCKLLLIERSDKLAL